MIRLHGNRIVGLALLFLALAGCHRDAAAPPARSARPPAQRTVVSLVPSVTETLFALGVGDRVVGRSRYCLDPPAALKLPVVGDALNVDLERLIVLKPDLIVFHTRVQSADRLTAAGIRPLALHIESVEDVYAEIESLGRELGVEPAAKTLTARLAGELAAVGEAARGAAPVATLITFPDTIGGGAEIRAVGRGTFLDQLLTLAGGRNVVPTNSYRPVSIETVVTWQPEVIIISAPGDIDPGQSDEHYRAAWNRWQSIPAVKNGHVYVLRQSYLTMPGPRMGEAARLLLATLHPDRAAALEKAIKSQNAAKSESSAK